MERNSPLKVPRGHKSTSSGVPPKKPRLDTGAAKPPATKTSSNKSDTHQHLNKTQRAASAITTAPPLPVRTTASLGAPPLNMSGGLKSQAFQPVDKSKQSGSKEPSMAQHQNASRIGSQQPVGCASAKSSLQNQKGGKSQGANQSSNKPKTHNPPSGPPPTTTLDTNLQPARLPVAAPDVPPGGASKTTTIYSGGVMSTSTMPMAAVGGVGMRQMMPMHFQARHVLPGQVNFRFQ